MAVSSLRFASALANRLNAVVPAAVTVRSDGHKVMVVTESGQDGGSGAAAILEDENGRDLIERIETACRAVLNGVQDGVMEELREGWPAQGDPGGLPLPGARVVGDEVHLWYGEEKSPAVRLQPIRLDDFLN